MIRFKPPRDISLVLAVTRQVQITSLCLSAILLAHDQ